MFEVAAENVATVNFYFRHQSGLWRYGFNGLESLDYGQVHHALALSGLEAEDQQAIFSRLLHLERGFLTEVSRQRKE